MYVAILLFTLWRMLSVCIHKTPLSYYAISLILYVTGTMAVYRKFSGPVSKCFFVNIKLLKVYIYLCLSEVNGIIKYFITRFSLYLRYQPAGVWEFWGWSRPVRAYRSLSRWSANGQAQDQLQESHWAACGSGLSASLLRYTWQRCEAYQPSCECHWARWVSFSIMCL